MRPPSLAGLAAAVITAPTMAGATFTFSADIYGRTADSGRLAAGRGTHTVLDLYLVNHGGADLRLLSVFNIEIALGMGEFVHHDGDPVGNWSATYNAFGANTAIDSFATFGDMSGDMPFAAALDPNFDGSMAGSVSLNAGWYNDDPANGQGNVVDGGQVFVGRFVVDPAGTETTFSVSGDLSYNFQTPGVFFDADSQIFTLPAVVPSPLALAVLGGIGFVGRGRRR